MDLQFWINCFVIIGILGLSILFISPFILLWIWVFKDIDMAAVLNGEDNNE